ncbi:putative Isy1 like splicing family [Trypanosoma vivax]|uniref:Uncharacterized protein n=1 Tax=Trypanosoma vivax (strain Y486) TaxID=1055687 RepID=G0U0C6_TRYVY|nr:hypothetical protein TRVL_00842 [Trypanosoma vivax]KAH8613772.1 putative Isy1 like splicing family [Trypanosoma vivax]CCC49524.1 conserved hypothetical protein [Trypanosoma vivax Y486]
MQDYLREIEGTLARKSERQSTLLYKLAKRKAEEKRLSRLGLRYIPSNPLEVTDVKVIKFVLFKIKQELGNAIAMLRDPSVLSIECHGEIAVRAKNDEANQLISKKKMWERRLAVINGQKYPGQRCQKLFFGCAAGLPEAQQKTQKLETPTENEVVNDWESDSHCSISSEEEATVKPSDLYISQLTVQTSENALRAEEMESERKLRMEYFHGKCEESMKRPREEANFVVDVVLPSEEELRKKLFDTKKQRLMERIKTLNE